MSKKTTVTVEGLEYSIDEIKAKLKPISTLRPGNVVKLAGWSIPYIVVRSPKQDGTAHLSNLDSGALFSSNSSPIDGSGFLKDNNLLSGHKIEFVCKSAKDFYTNLNRASQSAW